MAQYLDEQEKDFNQVCDVTLYRSKTCIQNGETSDGTKMFILNDKFKFNILNACCLQNNLFFPLVDI